MQNKIINRIRNTIKIEKIFNEIGFTNIKIIKNFKLVKTAIASTNIDLSEDNNYVQNVLNNINKNSAFGTINITFSLLDGINNDPIQYEDQGVTNHIEAAYMQTKQNYILLPHRCDLTIPTEPSLKQFAENQSQINSKFKYYFEHPIILIINCYLNNNGQCKYEFTKTIYFTKQEYQKFNDDLLAKKFNLYDINSI